MKIHEEKVWVIMSKCRQYIAKGTPRNRCLVRLDNKKDKKRLLTYKSEGMAISGFMNNWFYTWGLKLETPLTKEDMEAVEITLTFNINKP